MIERSSVKFSFYTGGMVFFLAVLYTVLSTKEYSPEELEKFVDGESEVDTKYYETGFIPAHRFFRNGLSASSASRGL